MNKTTVVKSLDHHSFNLTVPSTSVFLRYNCTNALTGSAMSLYAERQQYAC